jgi:hypothetical protein
MLRFIKKRGLNAGIKPQIRSLIAVIPTVARKSQEDKKTMSTVTTPVLSSRSLSSKIPTISTGSAARARICTACNKNAVSLNNKSGVCGACQQRQGGRSHSKKTNGNNGAQPPAPGPQLAPRLQVPAKPNGADHGIESPRVASRVDLLLAAVPEKDKEKMLAAWIAGAF